MPATLLLPLPGRTQPTSSLYPEEILEIAREKNPTERQIR